MSQIRIQAIPLTSKAAAAVVAAYSAFGSPLPRPIAKLIICSTLDQDVFVSLDGVTDNFYIARGSVTPTFFSISAGEMAEDVRVLWVRADPSSDRAHRVSCQRRHRQNIKPGTGL